METDDGEEGGAVGLVRLGGVSWLDVACSAVDDEARLELGSG